jgi:hypothetical protein
MQIEGKHKLYKCPVFPPVIQSTSLLLYSMNLPPSASQSKQPKQYQSPPSAQPPPNKPSSINSAPTALVSHQPAPTATSNKPSSRKTLSLQTSYPETTFPSPSLKAQKTSSFPGKAASQIYSSLSNSKK